MFGALTEMRKYRTEFDFGTNWSDKLSDAAAEEFRLEEREEELLAAVASLNGKKDRDSIGKLQKITGYDFKTKGTEKVEHKDGLLDLVRKRLSVIRAAMPTLTRAAQAYINEHLQVPCERDIFMQRQKEAAQEKILR